MQRLGWGIIGWKRIKKFKQKLMNLNQMLFESQIATQETWNNDIFIEDIKVNSDLLIGAVGDSLEFIDCTFFKNLNLIDVRKANFSIILRNVTVKLGFEIDASEGVMIVLHNCIFEHGIICKKNNFRDVIISGCDFFEFSKIVENTIAILEFKSNIIKQGITFRSNTITENFSLNSVNNLSYVFITDSISEVFKIKDLQISFDNKGAAGMLYMEDISLNSLVLGGVNISNIVFNNIKANFIGLTNFINNSVVTVNEINPLHEKCKIEIQKSNLGEARISLIDFSKFSEIKIIDSSVNQIIPNNIKWCKNINTKRAMKEGEKEDYENRKELFRQLKISASNNQNKFDELQFFKMEMIAAMKQEKISCFDWLVLCTNKFSNNHGQNWFIALCWIIGITTFFYTLVKFSLGETHFNINYLPNDLGRWFQFINPVHQFDKLFEVTTKQYTSYALMWDGISRIFIAYFIFQFVSAFRKFVKK
jgi:hypothetical protein